MQPAHRLLEPAIVRESRHRRILGFRILTALFSTVLAVGIVGSAVTGSPTASLVVLALTWCMVIALLGVATRRVQFHVFQDSIFLSRMPTRSLFWGGDFGERLPSDLKKIVIEETRDPILVTVHTRQKDQVGFRFPASDPQVPSFLNFLAAHLAEMRELQVVGILTGVPELGFLIGHQGHHYRWENR